VRAVRYRPGQRHVLRWEPGGDGPPLFAKLYRGGDGARAFALANRVADWLEAAGGPFGAARPLAHLAEVDLLLYPLVPGRPLLGAPAGSAAGRERQLRRAGAILRALHAAPAELADGLPASTFGDAAAEVHKAAGHIRFLAPGTGARLEDVLDRARKLHARLPGESSVFTHADYKADHLLATPERLTLIDFDTCALADPALDLGKLLADLRFRSLAGHPVDLVAARARFLAGYGAIDEARLARTRLYEALVLAKLTVRRVSVADPDWDQRLRVCLGTCAGLLDQLERETGA
jgi:hypothetical protein